MPARVDDPVATRRGDRGSGDSPRGARRRGSQCRSRDRSPAPASRAEALLDREWLVTNGLGGYASGTVAGVPTRRYHGLLIAALPAPLGRMVMLNHLSEQLRLSGRHALSSSAARSARAAGSSGRAPRISPSSASRRPAGLALRAAAASSSRSACSCRTSRTRCTSRYRLLGGGPRPAEAAPVGALPPARGSGHAAHRRAATRSPPSRIATSCRAARGYPPLRLQALRRGAPPSRSTAARSQQRPLPRRGRAAATTRRGDAVEPGLLPRRPEPRTTSATLVASTEAWETIGALAPDAGRAPPSASAAQRLARRGGPARARSGIGAELVLAADQFVITPGGPRARTPRARAPRATRCARSSPAITGSPTGAATR